ncbi:MAG: GTPase Era [Deltaproteobacteria bacterium]|nr:GTPase Era [Deltaproteobacteria bacterium]
MAEKPFKSGFVGIIGRPNVGKSTLLNTFLGEKIAITTPKPQTTRNRILGIMNTDSGQFVFLDTPGIHRAKTPLNLLMVKSAMETYGEADVLLLLVEADRGLHDEDSLILESLMAIKIPVILVINKIDLVKKETLLPLIDTFKDLYAFEEIIPISATRGFGVDRLTDILWRLLPEGPKLFPDDMITDRTERFIAAEIIREKIFLLTRQEIPYATAVVVEAFREEEERNFIRIEASIIVEKDSQKGIVIGKKGAMLKDIGRQARKDLERFFNARIYLELFVKVRKDWTHDERLLRELGYSEK